MIPELDLLAKAAVQVPPKRHYTYAHTHTHTDTQSRCINLMSILQSSAENRKQKLVLFSSVSIVVPPVTFLALFLVP